MSNDLFIDNELPEPLSKEELYECFKKFRLGDNRSKEKIIIHNIKLVIKLVGKFNYYDKKELVSIGLIGLINAVNSFDINRNVKFYTYASHCINNEILMFFRVNEKRKVEINLSSFDASDNIDNIDNIDNENNNDVVENILSVNQDYDLELSFENKELYRLIRNIIKDLPNKEKQIIILYFGFIDGKTYTQKEISKLFNVKQPRISKIISETLNKISEELQSNSLFNEFSSEKKYQLNKKNKRNY